MESEANPLQKTAIQKFTLFWHDPNINNPENQSYCVRLQNQGYIVVKSDDPDSVLQNIRGLTDEMETLIILVSSTRDALILKESLDIENNPDIVQAIIFCMPGNVEKNYNNFITSRKYRQGRNVVADFKSLLRVIEEICLKYDEFQYGKENVDQQFLVKNDIKHLWLLEYQKYYKLKHDKNWNGSLLDQNYLIDLQGGINQGASELEPQDKCYLNAKQQAEDIIKALFSNLIKLDTRLNSNHPFLLSTLVNRAARIYTGQTFLIYLVNKVLRSNKVSKIYLYPIINLMSLGFQNLGDIHNDWFSRVMNEQSQLEVF